MTEILKTWSIVDWFTVVGTVLTLAGLWIAIEQIRSARRSAEAARSAAVDARTSMRNNVILADLSRGVAIIDELQILIQGQRYDAALLRAQDLLGLSK